MKNLLIAAAVASAATLANAADVNPGVIFGSGVANGGFTVATGHGIEIGLRARVRYDASGQPTNDFNQVGNTNTYVFNPKAGNAPAGRATWNWDWSINTDVAGVTGNNLSDFIYELSIHKAGTDPALGAMGDLINDPIAMMAIDHSLGDNSTTAANDVVSGIFDYYGNISIYNVAQNSSNFGFLSSFFSGNSMDGWDPSDTGTWIITLRVFENDNGIAGAELLSTSINVIVVPLPPAAFAGLGLLGAIAGVRAVRRR